MTDRESVDYQLAEWVRGNSTHNDIRDECCPDFSCCQPKMQAPKEVREEFAAAGEEKREQMLMGFLGGGLAELGKRDKVFIAGIDGSTEQ